MTNQVENLINMLVRADARERVLEADNERLRDENAELEDTVHRQGNRLDVMQEDVLLQETTNVHLEGVITALKDTINELKGEVDELKGMVNLADLTHAWNTYYSVQPNAHEMWREIVPIAWQAEFENFVTYMDSNQKINAIKSVRAMTGSGLKVSKEFVEATL